MNKDLISVDTATMVKAISKFIDGRRAYSEKVIKATVSDLRSRAPGWIAGEVVKVYNLKKSELSPKCQKAAGSIQVQGDTIDTLAIKYSGRKLTPIHFKMKPTKLPKSSTNKKTGQKVRKTYVVSAEVLKGKRKDIKGAFLGKNPYGDKALHPFQRKEKKTAYPIISVKSAALPELVYTRRTKAAINKKLNEGVKARLEHNANRYKSK